MVSLHFQVLLNIILCATVLWAAPHHFYLLPQSAAFLEFVHMAWIASRPCAMSVSLGQMTCIFYYVAKSLEHFTVSVLWNQLIYQ